MLATLTPAEATTRITGLKPGEPLYDDVRGDRERKVGGDRHRRVTYRPRCRTTTGAADRSA